MFLLIPLLFVAVQASASEEKNLSSDLKRENVENLRELANFDISEISRGRRDVPENNPSYGEIKEAVKFATEKTGVREDFLMGMLSIESDFGRNTGKCTYDEVEKGAESSHRRGLLSLKAWNTFKHRREIIKSVAGELGYDYKKIKVSCNPSKYNGTGGALGIPQFMPDTWMEYKDELSNILGKKNPDPWSPRDGVLAMALKLSDVPGVTDHNRGSERNAAKLYLSGTTSWRYDWYANQVVYWRENNSPLS